MSEVTLDALIDAHIALLGGARRERDSARQEAADLRHALTESQRETMRVTATFERFAQYNLGKLEYQQTGRNPKANGYAFARVPEWALRKLMGAATRPPSNEGI